MKNLMNFNSIMTIALVIFTAVITYHGNIVLGSVATISFNMSQASVK